MFCHCLLSRLDCKIFSRIPVGDSLKCHKIFLITLLDALILSLLNVKVTIRYLYISGEH